MHTYEAIPIVHESEAGASNSFLASLVMDKCYTDLEMNQSGLPNTDLEMGQTGLLLNKSEATPRGLLLNKSEATPRETTPETRIQGSELIQHRADSVTTFAFVTTLLFASGLSELSGFVYEDWNVITGFIYLMTLCVSVGISLYCSLLSVLCVAIIQRVRAWDTIYNCREITEEQLAKLTNIVTVARCLQCSPAQVAKDFMSGRSLSNMLFEAFADTHRSPLGFGMLVFPWCCVGLVMAVTYRIVKAAVLGMQIAAFGVMIAVAVPTLLFSNRMVIILTG